jgi:hypothetical protein
LHVFGLFLKFSDAGLYNKSRSEILEEAKLYINLLKDHDQLDYLDPYKDIENISNSYYRLGFQENESSEFQELKSHINLAREQARTERIPDAVQVLLDAMQSDVWKFHRMICESNLPKQDDSEPEYHDEPILASVAPAEFIERILQLQYDDQLQIFSALKERYKFLNTNKKLTKELQWLKSLQKELLEEANRRKGKLSGFSLGQLNSLYLVEAIANLKKDEEATQSN